jgi:hypothetical protein
MFDAAVFAGGGNRCYGQGWFYETAAPRLALKPKLVVGASAGAFAATYWLLRVDPDARRRAVAQDRAKPVRRQKSRRHQGGLRIGLEGWRCLRGVSGTLTLHLPRSPDERSEIRD